MRVAAKYPKAETGITSEKEVAMKAEAVVKLVTNIALDALRVASAILLWMSSRVLSNLAV